jgi:dTDP-glucose 4,6-dehydratase
VVNLDKLTYAGIPERLKDISEGASYRFVKGDIADRSAVDRLFHEERPWEVVNFAAESHVDRSILDSSPFLHTNVLGVQVLLEASRHYNVERFVQASTDEVYGDAEGQGASTEDSPLRPSSPYAASKAAADLFCLAYRRTYGTPVLIVRSSNNYGPFQFPEKLIPLILRNALVGEELPLYGDGLQGRDWLHVEENVRAIRQVLECGKLGRIYNVSAGEERTNLDVVRSICRIVAEETGQNLDSLLQRIRFVADRPGHDRRYAINSERIQTELGWRPQIPFEDGLKRSVIWYLENRGWLERATSGEYHKYYESVYQRDWKKKTEA